MDRFTQLRKETSQFQTQLRDLLTKPTDYSTSIQACLTQHARLHSSQITQDSPLNSLEDLLLDNLDEKTFRHIPANQEHSIAWNLWHMARIEDCTMNTLVAGTPTIFEKQQWKEKFNFPFTDTGNNMPPNQIIVLSETIDLSALRTYRQMVALQTRTIIKNLTPEDLKQKVQPDRSSSLLSNGCVRKEAQSLIDYWRKRTTAGLLLMPATRHNLVHLNEIYQLKHKK
ncbi:MAG: hypothetical protein CL609_23905 [Anaerolineaceae bacterium]|nr:hypothetical protein [Anaerolineaceae bacterium]